MVILVRQLELGVVRGQRVDPRDVWTKPDLLTVPDMASDVLDLEQVALHSDDSRTNERDVLPIFIGSNTEMDSNALAAEVFSELILLVQGILLWFGLRVGGGVR